MATAFFWPTNPFDGFLRGKRFLILEPRQEVHHGVSRFARARRNGRHSAAAPFAESERLCRKVCFVDQERVLGCIMNGPPGPGVIPAMCTFREDSSMTTST